MKGMENNESFKWTKYKDLKLNKKRSIVIIIGIILFKKLFSVATINILMLLTIVLLIGLAIVILKAIDIYKTKIR